MSATNLDLPVLISAEQIRRREFVTIRRGYDPDQVRDYMAQLADQVELMQSLLREARQEAETAIRASEKPRVDPYEELARRVAGVIREADTAAEKIRDGAREDAERMTGEARTDADRIRTDAQAHAEETRASADNVAMQARAEASRTIAGLATRRDAVVEQLAAMQEKLLAVAQDLERTIEIDGPEALPAQTDEAIARVDTPETASADVDGMNASGESAPSTEGVIDVTGGGQPPAPPSGATTGKPDALFAELDDPAYEELWEGTQMMRLELPDIPPLELDWGDDEDDVDDLRD